MSCWRACPSCYDLVDNLRAAVTKILNVNVFADRRDLGNGLVPVHEPDVSPSPHVSIPTRPRGPAKGANRSALPRSRKSLSRRAQGEPDFPRDGIVTPHRERAHKVFVPDLLGAVGCHHAQVQRGSGRRCGSAVARRGPNGRREDGAEGRRELSGRRARAYLLVGASRHLAAASLALPPRPLLSRSLPSSLPSSDLLCRPSRKAKGSERKKRCRKKKTSSYTNRQTTNSKTKRYPVPCAGT